MTGPSSMRSPTVPLGHCCCATRAARLTHDGWTNAPISKIIRAGRHIARPKRYLRNYGEEVEPNELVAEVERQAARGDGWVKLVGTGSTGTSAISRRSGRDVAERQSLERTSWAAA